MGGWVCWGHDVQPFSWVRCVSYKVGDAESQQPVHLHVTQTQAAPGNFEPIVSHNAVVIHISIGLLKGHGDPGDDPNSRWAPCTGH